MKTYLSQLKIASFFLLLTLVTVAGCASDTAPTVIPVSSYAGNMSMQSTNDLIQTPNVYTYSYPVTYGHQDQYYNSPAVQTYQTPVTYQY